MIRVWKEVLCRGRQRDRTGRWFAITGRDIANAQRNAARLLSRGYPIPCVWEHQNVEATDPEEWKARYAKFTFGHVVGQRLNDRGNLELCHELRDPADANQLLKTRFVSPKLYRSYSDPKGGEYRGTTIAHVAATPTPVQFWQRPFQLSRDKALYLSYTPGDAMADDTDKGNKGSDSPAGGKKTLADVIEALRESGMHIPDEVTDETGLIIAIKAGAGAGTNDGDDDGLDDLDTSADSANVAGAGSPPMLMSMTDPKPKAWAKNERIDAKRRVKALFSTGRVDRPTAQKLLRQVESVELSYTVDGDLVANAVLMKIAAYEDLPQNAAWNPNGRRDGGTELSDTRQVNEPSELSPGAGLNDVVKEQERLAGMFSVGKK